MFRKVAIALFAASMLAAPVIAQAAAPTTKPTAGATSATVVKTIKADKTALKHRSMPGATTAPTWPSTCTRTA
jgi:hypothetical protein